jgi:hypothetical protein
MKKIVILLVVVFILSFTGCGKNDSKEINTSSVENKITNGNLNNIENNPWELNEDLNEKRIDSLTNKEVFMEELHLDTDLRNNGQELFSDDIRKELLKIFADWDNNKINKITYVTYDDLKTFDAINVEIYPCEINGVEGLHFLYQYPKMAESALSQDDTVQIIIIYDGDKLSVYKCWLNLKFKYSKKTT